VLFLYANDRGGLGAAFGRVSATDSIGRIAVFFGLGISRWMLA
jgi:hypothetical protein